MDKKMIEIVVSNVDNYRLMLLMSGFVISIFYNERYIDSGQPILLKKRIENENDEMLEIMCRCVSHNGGRLVLV